MVKNLHWAPILKDMHPKLLTGWIMGSRFMIFFGKLQTFFVDTKNVLGI